MKFTMRQRATGMLSMLGALLTTYALFPMSAAAAPKTRCEIASKIKPLADRLSGDIMGLAYVVGIPLAVAGLAVLIFVASSNRSGGIMRAVGIIIGVLLLLGVSVGVLVAVVKPGC